MDHLLGKDVLVSNGQARKIYICSALDINGIICGHADTLKSADSPQRFYSPYLLIRKKIKGFRLLSQTISCSLLELILSIP